MSVDNCWSRVSPASRHVILRCARLEYTVNPVGKPPVSRPDASTYVAAASISPLRMRTARSRSQMKIFPFPTVSIGLGNGIHHLIRQLVTHRDFDAGLRSWCMTRSITGQRSRPAPRGNRREDFRSFKLVVRTMIAIRQASSQTVSRTTALVRLPQFTDQGGLDVFPLVRSQRT